MKRFAVVFIGLLAVFLVGVAHAAPLQLYLGTADSGNTTAASGVSTMVLEGRGYNRSEGLTVFKAETLPTWCAIQALDIDSSIAQQALGGTISKNWDVYIEHSLDSGMASTEKYYFFKSETATATTNNTSAPAWVKIPSDGFYKFNFVTASGTTVFDHAQFRVVFSSDGDASPPIPLSHAKDAFATTGVTPFTDSFTVPAGCRCVEIQFTGADGAYSAPATSGVSRILAEDDPPLQMPVGEFNSGSYGPGAAAAGTINAQFWTDCP